MKPNHKDVERRKEIHESNGHVVSEIQLIDSDYVAYLCSCRAVLCAEDEFYNKTIDDMQRVT